MLYYLIAIVKSLVLWLDFVLLTAVMYLLSFLPQALLDRFYPALFRFWSNAFVHAIGVDLRLHQKNLKPLPGQFILIANHPSAFEDIGVPALFNAFSLAKIEVRDWWIVGRISVAAGTLYVHRESRESRAAALDELLDTLQQGKSIALYPEGGCKGRRIFESFRYGAFDLSLRSGIPILPVFLHYEAQEDFEWAPPHTLLHKIWHMMTSRNNRANYYVFDAIDPKNFADKESYCNHVHNMYLQWQQKYLE
ncbi:MAG: 1-acyl-sn-glycerol-3-phosphate acyltransferase [Gammaproteobacteria bacterium]|nr:1-acyl-sn-glycerol-3-phosphate acyltransferase [Gammaproteobacteria bacterium]